MPRLSTELGTAGAWLTVALRGKLDVATAPALHDQVGLLITQETPPRIALELSQVSFCDSSGINAFIRLWKRAGAAGGELVLLRPPGKLAELLSRVGLDGYLRVCATLPLPKPRPRRSSRMLVLVEDPAQTLASSDVQVGDLV